MTATEAVEAARRRMMNAVVSRYEVAEVEARRKSYEAAIVARERERYEARHPLGTYLGMQARIEALENELREANARIVMLGTSLLDERLDKEDGP